MRVSVIGAGSWGMALAHVIAGGDRGDVVLWARRPAVADALQRTRHNPSYLTDLQLDAGIEVTAELGRAVAAASIVVLAVPTHAMRATATTLAPHLGRDTLLVSAAKGFEEPTSMTMSAVLCDVLGRSIDARVTALSGPNIAVEIARGLPAASVIAGELDAAAAVRDVLSSGVFRVYSATDRVGVEFAGALKNVLAIAVGACEGMGIGDNGKAAIMTRGIAEITRLGLSAGAQPMTFAGLAGLGDCVVTCMSPYSRNRQLGEAIARGATLQEAMAQVRMVVEGASAARVAGRLADKHGVDMPITREVNAVLFAGKPVGAALADLMRRDPAEELHGLEREDQIHSPRGAGE